MKALSCPPGRPNRLKNPAKLETRTSAAVQGRQSRPPKLRRLHRRPKRLNQRKLQPLLRKKFQRPKKPNSQPPSRKPNRQKKPQKCRPKSQRLNPRRKKHSPKPKKKRLDIIKSLAKNFKERPLWQIPLTNSLLNI